MYVINSLHSDLNSSIAGRQTFIGRPYLRVHTTFRREKIGSYFWGACYTCLLFVVSYSPVSSVCIGALGGRSSGEFCHLPTLPRVHTVRASAFSPSSLSVPGAPSLARADVRRAHPRQPQSPLRSCLLPPLRVLPSPAIGRNSPELLKRLCRTKHQLPYCNQYLKNLQKTKPSMTQTNNSQ